MSLGLLAKGLNLPPPLSLPVSPCAVAVHDSSAQETRGPRRLQVCYHDGAGTGLSKGRTAAKQWGTGAMGLSTGAALFLHLGCTVCAIDNPIRVQVYMYMYMYTYICRYSPLCFFAISSRGLIRTTAPHRGTP